MPSITAPGIGSGLDVQSIVSQLMAIERQPLQRLELKQSQVEAQISAYGQVSSSFATFQSAMENLDSLSDLKVFQTSSSDSDVIDATASSSADIGNFGVEVIRLAENHKLSSIEILDTDTFGGAVGDSLSIQVGADVANTITVDLTTAQTLQEVRDAINDDLANPGVSATIINGVNGNQKLIFTAKDSGSDNALTVSTAGTVTPANFGFQTVNDIAGDTSLLDAEIVVDGYNLTRSSNNISDVISGVTLNLVSANPGTTNTITIGRDNEAVTESVQSFADAFNDLRSDIKSLRSGHLEADSLLLSMERRIFNVLNTPATGGVYSNLSEIGLRMQKDGTMTLDSNDLNTALQTNFDGVAQLFAADGQGFANRMSSRVDTFLGVGGLIETRTDGLDSRVDDIEDRKSSFERSLQLTEARFRAQFSALDALVSRLQGTGNFLTAQLSQLPGANRG